MPVARSRTVLLAAIAVSACASTAPTEQEKKMVAMAVEKPILPASREERDAADRLDVLGQAAFWNKEYDKNPSDEEAALKLARVLRSIGSAQRATEIASQALVMKPGDVEFSLVLAQAALDIGKPETAARALVAAEGPGAQDWRVMSIIGVTMDSLNRHSAAQDYYRRGLTLSPGNPKILSNLGLSYALAGKPGLAEETLRQAIDAPEADLRVRQNLALVLGVQGKFAEAERIAGEETPRDLVDSNAAYFRALLSPSRNWDTLRGTQN
jgi:Flp pilus assembly protein TadD